LRRNKVVFGGDIAVLV